MAILIYFAQKTMEQLIILQGITVEQLFTRLDTMVEKKINEMMQQVQKVNPARYMTRKEVADFLHVSLPTLHDWTKTGLIKSYKIGNRVLFKSDEVEESLKGIKFSR